MPVVGLLALQGAFREHGVVMSKLGASTREIRQRKDVAGIDALILPGGESTTIGKLLAELDIMDVLRERIAQGMPVYGSCAGLILLCRDIEQSTQPRLGVLDATVRRNAFGSQVDSFEAPLHMEGIGEAPYTAVFIRAPFLTRVGEGVRVLAAVNGQPVAVQQGSLLATSFHPELTSDTRVHRYFLRMCAS